MSCECCEAFEKVCQVCGSIKVEGWEEMQGYSCKRKDLKYMASYPGEMFVWLMLKDGVAVKVGCGTMKKLLNETVPNARYVRFDRAVIWMCVDKWQRNELATMLCGLFEQSVVNRQGWTNYVYCRAGELIMPPGCCSPVDAFGDADFYIGDTPYWDFRKLEMIGVKRKKVAL